MALWEDLLKAELGLHDVVKTIMDEHPDQARAMRLVSAITLTESALACAGIATHFNCFHTLMFSFMNWVTLAQHQPQLLVHVLEELLPQMREALPFIDWDALETDLKEMK